MTNLHNKQPINKKSGDKNDKKNEKREEVVIPNEEEFIKGGPINTY